MQAVLPIILVLLLGGIIMFWNSMADGWVSEYDAQVPRNPETGIMLRAEPRTLGPEDAENAVLFVHGFIGSPNNYHDLPDQAAAAGWRVEAMLLPGHGTTPRDFETTSMDQLVDAVDAKVREMKEKYARVVLVGHSMGGAISTIVAADAPLDGLVLAAPYYAVTHKWYYLLRPETWAGVVSPLVRWIYRAPALQPVNRIEARKEIVSYNWIPTKGALTAIRIAAQARADRTIGAIKLPLLLIHSQLDTVTDPTESKAVFDRFPSENKRAVWLETSNHIIFWDFERDEVAREVLAFLDGIAHPTAP